MKLPAWRVATLLMLALVAACSMRSALDAMSSPEDRAFAQRMVESLRGGDEAWLQAHFRPDVWSESGKSIREAAALFPEGAATTELVSYNVSTSMTGGASQTQKGFTLVTHGGGRWTVTRFQTYSEGGPEQVVAWQVTPHSAPPPELSAMETLDAVLPWFWGTLAVGVVLVGGLIFWLVRRSRRKHDPFAAQGRRTP